MVTAFYAHPQNLVRDRMYSKVNKAVYTASSVACFWALAVTLLMPPALKQPSRTDSARFRTSLSSPHPSVIYYEASNKRRQALSMDKTVHSSQISASRYFNLRPYLSTI